MGLGHVARQHRGPPCIDQRGAGIAAGCSFRGAPHVSSKTPQSRPVTGVTVPELWKARPLQARLSYSNQRARPRRYLCGFIPSCIRYSACLRCFVQMGVADIRVDFWQGERFSIDELIDAAIRGGRIYADKQLVVTRTLEPYGLRFSGEIDITNSDAVPQSLSMAFVRNGDMHLDVSGLIFCDINGIRSFVDAAEAMDGGRLMLHGLPALLQKVMNVTGWSDIESLVLCDCKAVDR